MKKSLYVVLVVCICVCCFSGCSFRSKSYVVNEDLNQSANNFETLRKITVYNARTDLIIMEMEGYMSLSNNLSEELVVTCQTGPEEYKKNYVYLNEYVLYVVEDISGTITDPYHYKVHFYTAIPDVDINN